MKRLFFLFVSILLFHSFSFSIDAVPDLGPGKKLGLGITIDPVPTIIDLAGGAGFKARLGIEKKLLEQLSFQSDFSFFYSSGVYGSLNKLILSFGIDPEIRFYFGTNDYRFYIAAGAILEYAIESSSFEGQVLNGTTLTATHNEFDINTFILAPKLEIGFTSRINQNFIIEPFVNLSFAVPFSSTSYKVDNVNAVFNGPDTPSRQYYLNSISGPLCIDGGIRAGIWF